MPVPVPDDFDIDAEPLVEIEINDWWFSVLQGFFAEALDEMSWDGDDGDFANIQEAVIQIMALGGVFQEVGVSIKVGTYTGDGNSTKAITGVGFQPIFVAVWMRSDGDSNRGMAIRATGDTNGYTFQEKASDHFAYRDTIRSLDADGFTVTDDSSGDEFNCNRSSRVYTYVAFGE